MIYRALNTYGKSKGLILYLPNSSSFVTSDKSKAKTWKTEAGIQKWMDKRGTAAGYEIEAEDDH